MLNRKFEVVINGKSFILPFEGIVDNSTTLSKGSKKEKNYLFLGKEFSYNTENTFYELKMILNGRECCDIETIKDIETGVTYHLVKPNRMMFNDFALKLLNLIQDNSPVLYDASIKIEDVFKGDEYRKYLMDDFSFKLIPVFDLIERNFKIWKEEEFLASYKVSKVLSNKSTYLCVKNNPELLLVSQLDVPNIAYVVGDELRLSNHYCFVKLNEDDSVEIMEHDQRFLSFKSFRYDLPEVLKNVSVDEFSVNELKKYIQLGTINVNGKYSLIDAISASDLGKEKEIFAAIPLLFREKLWDFLETA